MTDEITFNDEPDLPPAIFDLPSASPKIGGFVWIDNGDPPEWLVQVQVRDENVAQALVAHWRLVHEGDDMPRFESRMLPLSGDPVRDFEFRIRSRDLFDGKCHLLELAVSGSFFSNDSNWENFAAVPVGREGDVAYARWWIWEGPGESASADYKGALVDSCDAVEELVTPSALDAPPLGSEAQ